MPLACVSNPVHFPFVNGRLLIVLLIVLAAVPVSAPGGTSLPANKVFVNPKKFLQLIIYIVS